VHYHPCYLERPLKVHSFSVLRPAAHDLGAARDDTSAAAGEQAAGGVEHCGNDTGWTPLCPPRPHQHLKRHCDLGSALLPETDWHAAAVVWDRLNAHRSQVTTAFIAALPQDYAVAYLPAYAPELNPEEQCNAFVKRAMEDALPESVADLHRQARREFVRLQRRPEMIVSFFRHAGLSVAGLS
jgi:hypothetical protein